MTHPQQREPRTVCLDTLRRHLADALGEDTLLYRRFARSLTDADERGLTDAMDSLVLYPPAVRARVEQALLRWLFDDADAGDALAEAGQLTL